MILPGDSIKSKPWELRGNIYRVLADSASDWELKDILRLIALESDERSMQNDNSPQNLIHTKKLIKNTVIKYYNDGIKNLAADTNFTYSSLNFERYFELDKKYDLNNISIDQLMSLQTAFSSIAINTIKKDRELKVALENTHQAHKEKNEIEIDNSRKERIAFSVLLFLTFLFVFLMISLFLKIRKQKNIILTQKTGVDSKNHELKEKTKIF